MCLSGSKDKQLLIFNYVGEIEVSGFVFFPTSINTQNHQFLEFVSNFSLGHCWIYGLVLLQIRVHLGISGGIVQSIVSSFVETIKMCCFMLYINTVNIVSYFKVK